MIQSGKNLKDIFAERQGFDRSKSIDVGSIGQEVLPVFNNKNYTEHLSKLVNSKDLERSFDLANFKQYSNIYNAYIAYEKGFEMTDEG